MQISIYGLSLPEIKVYDDLASLIVEAASSQGIGIADKDIIAITDKVISKSLGLFIKLSEVQPTKKAEKIAKKTGLDARFVELVLKHSDDLVAVVPIKRLAERGVIDIGSLAIDRESAKRILEKYPSFFLTIRNGSLWSDSGIDSSNLPEGFFAIPADKHDLVAKNIRERVSMLTSKKVAVVICDTEVFLGGSMDFARGSYGIEPIDRCFGCPDMYGKPKYGGVDMIAHEICSAASLVFKQTSEKVPVAILRGVKYRECECGLKDSMPRLDIEKVVGESLRETKKVLGLSRLLKLFKYLFL